MKVELISWTHGASTVCNIAAKACTSPSIPDIDEELAQRDTRALEHALASGHESVIEHATFTFSIEGISRACSHQLVRHRMASYSQQSQRYVNPVLDGLFRFVEPTSISRCTTLIDGVSKFPGQVNYEYCQLMYLIGRMYNQMIEAGIPEEDARYILPNACCTNLVMSMNARELRHFLKLRLCKRAQWEIRELAERMLDCVKQVSEVLFADVGPACEMDGKCPERKPCNKKKLQVAVESQQAYKEDGIENAIMDVKG